MEPGDIFYLLCDSPPHVVTVQLNIEEIHLQRMHAIKPTAFAATYMYYCTKLQARLLMSLRMRNVIFHGPLLLAIYPLLGIHAHAYHIL